ncbi:TetR/AcrR family transcriptional regulator [Paenibacillus sp. DYY-L-2]|uniref:TetR/AcrR family transcriptional regulator n=1 Tax=Paenibacillus sp. DYY-L-2 TaxID=3447013 RepID=UPI003F4FE852
MKDRIMDCVLEEIMQRGLKFSIRDIAARLGISTKTIYQHFESKERMIDDLVDRCIQDMRDAEADLMNNPSLPTPEKLRQALVILPSGLSFGDNRVIQELKQKYPDSWKKVDAYIQQGWGNIGVLAAKGWDEGTLRPFDLELFIQVYIGALSRLMDFQVSKKMGLTLDQALVQMVELMMRGVTGDAAGEGE